MFPCTGLERRRLNNPKVEKLIAYWIFSGGRESQSGVQSGLIPDDLFWKQFCSGATNRPFVLHYLYTIEQLQRSASIEQDKILFGMAHKKNGQHMWNRFSSTPTFVKAATSQRNLFADYLPCTCFWAVCLSLRSCCLMQSKWCPFTPERTFRHSKSLTSSTL